MSIDRQTIHLLGAPALFLLLAFSPVAGVPYEVRASIGLLLWMSWWWITTFQGIGLNPIPFVYIVSVAADYGLMLPSASAGPAIAAGYEVNLSTMFWRGLWLSALCWVVLLVIGYLLATMWPGFSVA